MESSALEVLDDSEEEVYHARQPRTKRAVEADAVLDLNLVWEAASEFERLFVNSRGLSMLRLSLCGESHDDAADDDDEDNDDVGKDDREA